MKKIFLTMLVLILLAGCGGNDEATDSDFAYDESPDIESNAIKVGKIYASYMDIQDSERIIIGYVDGDPIYHDEFELNYKLFAASDVDDPYAQTLINFQSRKAEQKYASENNITVTIDEALEFIEYQKDLIYNYSKEDDLNDFKTFVSVLGLTEDEYWNVYKIDEATKYLYMNKVGEHMEKNNKVIDPAGIPIVIFDKAYGRRTIDTTLF